MAQTTCSNHGSCNSTTGQCICDPTWDGVNCSTCLPHHFGPSCQCMTFSFVVSCGICSRILRTDCDESLSCHQHGTCGAVGECICFQSYNGSDCSQCNAGYYSYPYCIGNIFSSFEGFKLINALCLECAAATTCNGLGDCRNNLENDSTPICACYPGFDPSTNCSTCSPGFDGYPICTRMYLQCLEDVGTSYLIFF